MNDKNKAGGSEGIGLADIYYVLFRHKRKIMFLGLVGLLAAGVFFKFNPPPFVSQAVLIVDPNPTQMPGEKAATVSSSASETHINNEISMLTSLDSLKAVVTNVGAAKILAGAGGGNDTTFAAYFIKANLFVEHPKWSTLVRVSFHHPNPNVAQDVLRMVLDQYAQLGKQTHSDSGGQNEVMHQKSVQAKSLVTRLESQIEAVRTNSGVFSPEEAMKSLNDQINTTQKNLDVIIAELAERRTTFTNMLAVLGTNASVVLNAASNAVPGTNASKPAIAVVTTNTAPLATEPPTEVIEEYQQVRAMGLKLIETKERELQLYTLESHPIELLNAQIKPWEEKRRKLEKDYPKLATMPLPGSRQALQASAAAQASAATKTAPTHGPDAPFDPVKELAAIRGLESKIEYYQTVLTRQLIKGTNVSTADQAMKTLEESLKQAKEDYKKYGEYADQMDLKSKLAVSIMSSPVVESPTPALKDKKSSLKVVAFLSVGGFALGIAWAFLVEFFLDRSIKRAKDVEVKLGLPLLLSVPDVRPKGLLGLLTGRRGASKITLQIEQSAGKDGTGGDPSKIAGDAIALWDHNHALHTYYEALRDRLIGYFEVRNLTHKPKLVAVTGASLGAGTSTIAMGLAASLSETGEGNVLLVDMNQQNGAAHQFFKGQPGLGLDEALADETRDTGFVHKNLYVANGTSNADKLPRILPKRFSSLLPKLKASDYDYIIFDMPPVSQTSITPRLAGFMDMVLMVVESEKTDREAAQRALAMLADSKANVSAVLNKTRNYVPSTLLPES